ncbi:MAG: precorrin-3B C(17)-methyltransferase [Lachnospiraceae bacterium]|nr:precorrin-3B C(17)-methyltransferase [Lachnospiraceae bacterium]
MAKLLYVTGIGPGKSEMMTREAARALHECGAVAGYSVYAELVREEYPDKEYIITPMTKERERCELALKKADEGITTAMVCSGDAGVYGMAGLVLELSGKYPEVEVYIIPGVTAALSGAAVLGAPISHDFAVISLSDLLTPWEKIEKRLRCAAEGDFNIVLYNPSSKKRKDHLRRACDILMESISPDRACGYVKNIGRDGEEAHILTLKELSEAELDMFTTVFIGSENTFKLRCRDRDMLVTRRIPVNEG